METSELSSFVPTWLTSRLEPLASEDASVRVPGALVFADISGFTALSVALATKHGPAGAERLSIALDTFFAALLDEVRNGGGVPISFAGDGLLACFPATSDDETARAAATVAAARTALAMIDRVALLGAVEGVAMGLHAGVVAGDLALAPLGGHRGRHAAVILGAPVRRLGRVFAGTTRGQAVIAAEALDPVRRWIEAQPIDAERSLLLRVRAHAPLPPAPSAPDALVDRWLPDAVRQRAALPLGRWMAEMRTLTLLFVSLGPIADEGVSQASAAVRAVMEELELHHGALHQVTVDEKGLAVTSAFGLGSPGGDRPAISAARCAIALRERFVSLGVAPRIGVATGRVFVGPVGDAGRRQLAIVGTTMIRAARMAQAEAGVTLDEASRVAADEAVELEAGPTVRVRDEVVTIWRALGARRRARHGGGDSLVGRAQVRAILDAALDRLARASEGSVVSLDGPAGIGKSRLAAHAADGARALGIAVLEVSGDLPSVDRPYHGLRAELERHLGIEAGMSPAVRAERAEEATRALATHEGLAPLLAPALGIAIPESARTVALAPSRRAELVAELVTQLLTRGQPRVVIVDDAQWLDGATALVIERLVAAAAPTCMVLCTRVPADELPLPVSRLAERAQRVRVVPLEPEEVEALVAAQLGVRSAPPTLARWIASRAGGNPFFVREVAASLLAARLVEVADGAVVRAASAEELDRSAPPPSVEAVVTRRIDALDSQAQLALKAASVLGMRFSSDVLAALHPLGADAARSALETLTDAGLVHPSEGAGAHARATFEVAHRIVLDVAYGLLPGELRAQLHGTAASWLEARGDAEASELAWHFEHAGDAPRALRWLDRAWADADRAGALVESHGLARRAHALTPASETVSRARWLRRMSDASAWLAIYQRATEESGEALAVLGRAMPADKRAWRTMLARGVASQLAHRILPSRAWARREDAAEAETALALARAGEGFYFVQSDQLVALACFLESVNAAERVGGATEGRVPNSFGVIGTALGAMGMTRAGDYYHRRALATATASGEHGRIAEALFHIASSQAMRGQWRASDATYERCAEHEREAGRRHPLVFIRGAQGVNALIRGDLAFATTVASELAAHAAALRHARGTALAQSVQALVALLRGDHRAAEALARPARDAMREAGDVTWMHPASTLARALVLRGDPAAAIAEARAVRQALRGARPADYRRLESFAGPAETLLRIPGHDPHEVDDALALLHSFARAQGAGSARYQLLHGIALSRRGDRRGAEAALASAVKAAGERELALDLARAKLALARVRSDRIAADEARAWLTGEGIALPSVEMDP